MRGHAPKLKLLAAALLTGAVVLAPAAAGDPAQALRQRDAELAAKSRAAVLSLYALDSQLARARARLDAIRGRSDAMRRQRQIVALQLGVAKHGLKVSQIRLAERLRGLYERGDIDPIAIVLGADSLDSALTGIESLGQIANGDRQVVRQLRAARSDLNGLQARLTSQQRTLDGLVRAAAVTTATLTSSRASRAAYVGQLATQRKLTQSSIARIQEQARLARLKAQTLEVAAPAAATPTVDSSPATTTTPGPVDVTPTAPSADTPAAPAAPATAGGRTLVVSATGYALGGTTATGLPVGWGVAAVDPSVIPLGTRFVVPGYGEAVAADIGGGVHGNTIDLWFPSVGQAQGWGRRTVTITLR